MSVYDSYNPVRHFCRFFFVPGKSFGFHPPELSTPSSTLISRRGCDSGGPGARRSPRGLEPGQPETFYKMTPEQRPPTVRIIKALNDVPIDDPVGGILWP